MKINPDLQVELTSRLVAETLAAYGVEAAGYREEERGIGHTVVHVTGTDGDEYYLKYYRRSHNPKQTIREVAFANQAALRGLSVPEYMPPQNANPIIIVHTPRGRHTTTLTKAINGEHPTEYTADLLQELGQTHAALHHESAKYAAPHAFNPIAHYNFYTPTPSEQNLRDIDDQARTTIAVLANMWDRLPNGLAPMDIKRDNVIVEDGKLKGVIDLADINMAPLVFCLAGTLWDVLESSQGSLTHVQKYIDAYESTRPLNPLERMLLPQILAIRSWIELHGTLLANPASKQAREQAALVQQSFGYMHRATDAAA